MLLMDDYTKKTFSDTVHSRKGGKSNTFIIRLRDEEKFTRTGTHSLY